MIVRLVCSGSHGLDGEHVGDGRFPASLALSYQNVLEVGVTQEHSIDYIRMHLSIDAFAQSFPKPR